MQDLEKFYEEDKDFKDYIDKFMKSCGEPKEEVLKKSIIHEVAQYYHDRKEGKE